MQRLSSLAAGWHGLDSVSRLTLGSLIPREGALSDVHVPACPNSLITLPSAISLWRGPLCQCLQMYNKKLKCQRCHWSPPVSFRLLEVLIFLLSEKTTNA